MSPIGLRAPEEAPAMRSQCRGGRQQEPTKPPMFGWLLLYTHYPYCSRVLRAATRKYPKEMSSERGR